MSRSIKGRKVKIEFAPQDQIDALEDISRRFFREVLGMTEVFVTDESMLWDMCGCGEDCKDFPESLVNTELSRAQEEKIWFGWVKAKIVKLYGISPDKIPGMESYFIDIFREIRMVERWKHLPVQ